MPSALIQEIVEHLEALPQALQERVLLLVREFHPTLPQGIPGADLLQFAGAISTGDLQLMQAAIEQDCERIENYEQDDLEEEYDLSTLPIVPKGRYARRPGNTIRWRLHLPVPPEQVYGALDSNEGRAAFWAESAIEQAGVIDFHFINGYRCTSPILQRAPHHLWVIDYMGGEARFELTADGAGGTDLLLTHAGISDEEWNETHAGWLNVLLPLKVWVLYGIDIRNHDPARTWDQGYVDQ